MISCYDDDDDDEESGHGGACAQFLGVPGRIYNLISDSVVDISLNALFSVAYTSGLATDVDTLVVTPYTAQGTWIKAIGLKVG